LNFLACKTAYFYLFHFQIELVPYINENIIFLIAYILCCMFITFPRKI